MTIDSKLIVEAVKSFPREKSKIIFQLMLDIDDVDESEKAVYEKALLEIEKLEFDIIDFLNYWESQVNSICGTGNCFEPPVENWIYASIPEIDEALNVHLF